MKNLQNTAFCWLVLAALSSVQTLSQGEKQFVSPRLSTLQKELDAGNAAAMENFWREIGKQGTPLIEPLAGNEGHCLVTFLWRAKEEARNVSVYGGVAGIETGRNRMTRLGATDLWFRTYRVRNDARFAYRLSVNDPFDSLNIFDPDNVRAEELRRATFQADPLNPHGASGASVVELSGAPPQPWIIKRADVPAGRVEWKRLKSAILGNERDIGIYTPPSYKTDGRPYSEMK